VSKNKNKKNTEIRRQSSSSREKSLKVEIPEGISFSYRYYQSDRDKFSIRGKDTRYLEAFLQRLRDLSMLTEQEVINNRSKSLRCHSIEWWNTTEPDGFGIPNESQLVDPPYQFQISANEHGRVHGFFSENIFYIVWLDPEHNLYS
jgi:hypothetical protein